MVYRGNRLGDVEGVVMIVCGFCIFCGVFVFWVRVVGKCLGFFVSDKLVRELIEGEVCE